MNQNRQPKGLPVGGQFAGSRRDEASVALVETDGNVHFSGDEATELSRTSFNEACRYADQWAADKMEGNDTHEANYNLGWATSAASAHLFVQGAEPGTGSEDAWQANNMIETITGDGTHRVTPGWRVRAERFHPGPLPWERARPSSDSLLRQAFAASRQARSAAEHGDWQGEAYANGRLNAAVYYAVALREGKAEPTPETYDALAQAIRDYEAPKRLIRVVEDESADFLADFYNDTTEPR